MKAHLYTTTNYVAEINFKHELPLVGDIISFDSEYFKVIKREFPTYITNPKFSKKNKFDSSDIVLYVEQITNNYINGIQNKK